MKYTISLLLLIVLLGCRTNKYHQINLSRCSEVTSKYHSTLDSLYLAKFKTSKWKVTNCYDDKPDNKITIETFMKYKYYGERMGITLIVDSLSSSSPNEDVKYYRV
jgi:hypothetical protein